MKVAPITRGGLRWLKYMIIVVKNAGIHGEHETNTRYVLNVNQRA